LVNDEPFSPEEAEFFLESAIEGELEMLERVAMIFPGGDTNEGYEEGREDEQIESDDD
jgi:hypothetical protein